MLIDIVERENLYFSAIRGEFQRCALGVDAQTRVMQWLDDAAARRLDGAQVEQVAGEILQAYPQLTGGHTERYQFKASSQKNALIKCIFDQAFKKVTNEGEAERMIQLAESAIPGNRAFYPKWKKIVYMHLPKCAGETVGNLFFRILAGITIWRATFKVMDACYVKINDLTARVLVPFVINNTPLLAIKILNKATNLIIRTYNIVVPILIGCMLLKWAISGSEMFPYINNFLNRFDFFQIYMAIPTPTTFLVHVIETAIKAIQFTNSLCNRLSFQLKSVATSNQHHQLALSREKAFAVWSTLMSNRLEPVSA